MSRDAANIFDSPGLPSLNVKILLQQFVILPPELTGNGANAEDKENLARWIPRRVIWEDVPECITVGLKREGFVD
jgi:hypothetical protein